VCLNVLEHIEDDRQALRGMASILGPGGVIVLLVPAFPALYGPIDSNLGHYRRYSRGAIATLADSTGLRIRKVHYVNAVGFFGWWVNSHILRRGAQSERQIEIFDRYLVPLLSRLEGMVPPPFGQSLFVVLEKP
jgi:SAM-dependent methyltransferase